MVRRGGDGKKYTFTFGKKMFGSCSFVFFKKQCGVQCDTKMCAFLRDWIFLLMLVFKEKGCVLYLFCVYLLCLSLLLSRKWKKSMKRSE